MLRCLVLVSLWCGLASDAKCTPKGACEIWGVPDRERGDDGHGDVGHGSCNGESACYTHTGGPIPGTIGVYSCIGQSACFLQIGGVTVGHRSCTGKGACASAFAGPIEDDSCRGPFACNMCNGPIRHNSCRGDKSCFSVCEKVSSVKKCEIGQYSCHGTQACDHTTGAVGSNSCNGTQACIKATGTVGNNACVGTQACDGATGEIGQNSCKGTQACHETTVQVGDMSCRGDKACHNTRGTVGNNACVGTQACDGATGNIGRNACRGKDGSCQNCPVDVPDGQSSCCPGGLVLRDDKTCGCPGGEPSCCLDKCSAEHCQPGHGDGGVFLVNGKCMEICNEHGRCGSGDAYNTGTSCEACGCSQKCVDCRPGSEGDGGVPLINGRCTEYCSQDGHCGTSSGYTNGGTSCKLCACPQKCKTCRDGASESGGLCTSYCNLFGRCYASQSDAGVQSTDCTSCGVAVIKTGAAVITGNTLSGTVRMADAPLMTAVFLGAAMLLI